ncbi:TPA: hypothetical protein ACGOVK_002292 [Streptococcus suis]
MISWSMDIDSAIIREMNIVIYTLRKSHSDIVDLMNFSPVCLCVT